MLGQLALCLAGCYLAFGLIYIGGGMYLLQSGWGEFQDTANPAYGGIPGLPKWFKVLPFIPILVAIPQLIGSWAVWKEKSWGYPVAIIAFLVGIPPYGVLGAPKLLMAALLFMGLKGMIRWPLWRDAPPPPVPPPYHPPPPQRQIEQSSREKPRR